MNRRSLLMLVSCSPFSFITAAQEPFARDWTAQLVQAQVHWKRIVSLEDYRFICRYKHAGQPLSSGVIFSRAKTKKLGDEPPRGAVIAESIKRYSANREASDKKILDFLAPNRGDNYPFTKRPNML